MFEKIMAAYAGSSWGKYTVRIALEILWVLVIATLLYLMVNSQ